MNTNEAVKMIKTSKILIIHVALMIIHIQTQKIIFQSTVYVLEVYYDVHFSCFHVSNYAANNQSKPW